MNRTSEEILNYYDKEVVKQIHDKYSYSFLDAFRKFINSETYNMLSDSKYKMWEFGPIAIFDMWENEIITGKPQTSIYLRGVNND